MKNFRAQVVEDFNDSFIIWILTWGNFATFINLRFLLRYSGDTLISQSCNFDFLCDFHTKPRFAEMLDMNALVENIIFGFKEAICFHFYHSLNELKAAPLTFIEKPWNRSGIDMETSLLLSWHSRLLLLVFGNFRDKQKFQKNSRNQTKSMVKFTGLSNDECSVHHFTISSSLCVRLLKPANVKRRKWDSHCVTFGFIVRLTPS